MDLVGTVPLQRTNGSSWIGALLIGAYEENCIVERCERTCDFLTEEFEIYRAPLIHQGQHTRYPNLPNPTPLPTSNASSARFSLVSILARTIQSSDLASDPSAEMACCANRPSLAFCRYPCYGVDGGSIVCGCWCEVGRVSAILSVSVSVSPATASTKRRTGWKWEHGSDGGEGIKGDK
jgi:hypothetical protein